MNTESTGSNVQREPIPTTLFVVAITGIVLALASGLTASDFLGVSFANWLYVGSGAALLLVSFAVSVAAIDKPKCPRCPPYCPPLLWLLVLLFVLLLIIALFFGVLFGIDVSGWFDIFLTVNLLFIAGGLKCLFGGTK